MSLRNVIVSGAAALALVGTAGIAATNNYKAPSWDEVKPCKVSTTIQNREGKAVPKAMGCEDCYFTLGVEQYVVRQALDGTGDYLLAPVYYAVNNWSTELKVVNTNTTKAVVAKVVVRESKESKEIMDFAIYLTPGDVWTGVIYDDNGIIKLKSTDDSMIIGGQPASPGHPIIIGSHARREDPESGKYHQENWHGYVEIFGMAAFDPAKIVEAYNKTHDPKVPAWDNCKALDKKAFYTAVKDGNDLRFTYNGVDLNATDVTNCDLMGKEIIYAEASNINDRRYMALNMMALENFSLKPKQKGAIGGDTTLSNMTSKGESVLLEYDRALAKEKIYVMYEGDGNEVYPIRTHFTVPTKKYWFDLGVLPSVYAQDDLYEEDPVPGFNPDTGSEWMYTINKDGNNIVARDMSENCNKCNVGEISGENRDCAIPIHEEVHFFEYENTNPSNLYDSSNPYKSLLFATGGYVTFDLSDNQYETSTTEKIVEKIIFRGLPVVPTTFYAKKVQGTYFTNWLYNQYRDALVLPIDED